jgi:hypothetical protein
MQFFLMIADCVAIPLSLVSLAAFWRWPGFFLELSKNWDKSFTSFAEDYGYNANVRQIGMWNFGIVLLDCFAIPMGLVRVLCAVLFT